jgi:hypothetical protein
MDQGEGRIYGFKPNKLATCQIIRITKTVIMPFIVVV